MKALKKSRKVQKMVDYFLNLKETHPLIYSIVDHTTDGVILGTLVLISIGVAYYAYLSGFCTFDSAMVGVALFDINLATIFFIKDDLRDIPDKATKSKKVQKKAPITEPVKIKRALTVVTKDNSAEYMAELLMDPNMSTWKMYEDLAQAYMRAEDPIQRKGIDEACTILTGYCMRAISEQLIKRYSLNSSGIL